MRAPSEWKSRQRELRPLQPWPAYYDFRSREMQVVAALCEMPRGESLLELGCGNAFHSFLLSDQFERVVATDLFGRDTDTHTIGLDRARGLVHLLGVDNIQVVAASADALPVASQSQDCVFSSNVLEHVPDQTRAVEEIHRVLKPGGTALHIMPAAMERVYNFPVSYLMVVAGMMRGLRNRSESRGTDGLESIDAGNRNRPRSRLLWKRATSFFGRHYPRFPFPAPHGAYASSTEEFLAHLPSRWEALFRSAGFTIERSFTTILAPHNIGMIVSPRQAYWIARLGWPLTEFLGGMVPFKYFGTSFGILARRPVEDSCP
ncbi:MAG: class I SAM-dependent methyltransferase [Acidobacteriota bacterium]